MAGLESGAWTYGTVNGRLVMECDVVMDTSISDAYTLKTPARTLDPTKRWLLMVNTGAADLDGSALPCDIWAGFADDFALSGDTTTVAATHGGEVASAVVGDVNTPSLTVVVDPNYHGTFVQSSTNIMGIVNAGTAPYYAFNLDGATLKSATCHFIIVQDQ